MRHVCIILLFSYFCYVYVIFYSNHFGVVFVLKYYFYQYILCIIWYVIVHVSLLRKMKYIYPWSFLKCGCGLNWIKKGRKLVTFFTKNICLSANKKRRVGMRVALNMSSYGADRYRSFMIMSCNKI